MDSLTLAEKMNLVKRPKSPPDKNGWNKLIERSRREKYFYDHCCICL